MHKNDQAPSLGKKESNFFATLKRFFEPMKNIQSTFWWLVLFGALNGIIQILTVEGFRYATNFLELSLKEQFLYAMVALFVLEALNLGRLWWFKLRDWRMLYAIRRQVNERVMRQFMLLDHNYVDLLGIGRLQSIMLTGVYRRSVFIMELLLKGTSIIVLAVGSLYVLFRTDIRVGLGAIISLFFVFVIFYIRNKGDRAWRRKAKEVKVDLDKLSVMQMMSKFEIIQSDKLNDELEKYDTITHDLTYLETQRGRYNFLAYRTVFSLFGFVQVISLFIVGYFVLDGRISLSDFFVMVLSFRLLLKMLMDVKTMLRLYSKEFVNIEKVRDTIDDGPKLTGVYEGNDFVYSGDSLVFDKVTFGYSDDKPILEDFGLKIMGGKKTALVGASGGGKTTLVKLISGYLRPNAGSIIIDGQDLHTVSLKSYYKQIGYLTQEPSVFDGTIYENLMYALDKKLDDAVVDEILRKSKCEFVYDLPDGLHTEIGERGIRLSGGQRQRLAIAKIFLKDPKILILDEPTSALDSFSEEAITNAMNNLFDGRTVIIIAHRLQTVLHADEIIVLDDGKVIESGTHQELIDQEGSYAELLRLQSGF